MPINLHAFFVYVFFGYFFIFPVVFLCVKVFAIEHPRQRMGLYMTALIVPFAGFLLYNSVLATRCQTGYYPGGIFWTAFDLFCLAGNTAIRFLGPILALLLLLGLFKAAGSGLYLARLRSRALEPTGEQQAQVMALLRKHCSKWQLTVPEVIFTGRSGFVAFAAGMFKPVVVVSVPLLEQLDVTELEAILVHELVHIRRRDTVSGWLLHLSRDLMFFSPFSTVLLNSYMLERERLCDRETVKELGRPRAYAATMLKTWRLLVEQKEPRFGMAAGFMGKKQDMELRIHSLLTADVNDGRMPTLLFATLLVSVVTLTIVYLGYIC